MTDIICINDTYPPEVLEFQRRNGITVPIKDKMYSVREMKRNVLNFKMAVLLNEIHNPSIPIQHPTLGIVNIEPTFDIARFATLSGEPIKKEEFVKEEA